MPTDPLSPATGAPKPGARSRAGRLCLVGLLLAVSPVSGVRAQNSFPLADLVPLARGGALGGQALAGDLLAIGIDPTQAAGRTPGVEVAAGSSVLDLTWAAAGARFELFRRPLAVTVATLSWAEQYRTDLDDRLGIFGGTFSPSDVNLSLATILLAERTTLVGVSTTVSFGKIDAATAAGVSAAVAVRQGFSGGELRAALSGAGVAFSPYGESGGTRLPARLRAGGALRPGNGRIEVSGETLYRFGDRRAGWGAGVEWRPVPAIALRTGFGGGDAGAYLADGTLADIGLTAGVAWQQGDWRISYLYRPGGLLGTGHLVALGWRLGTLP